MDQQVDSTCCMATVKEVMIRTRTLVPKDGSESVVPGEVWAGRYPLQMGLAPHMAPSLRHNCAESHRMSVFGRRMIEPHMEVDKSRVQIEDSDQSQHHRESREQISVSVGAVVGWHWNTPVPSTHQANPPTATVQESGLLRLARSSHQARVGVAVV